MVWRCGQESTLWTQQLGAEQPVPVVTSGDGSDHDQATRNCGHYEMVLRQESAPVVHYRLNINYQMLPYLALSEDPSAFGGFLLGMEPSFVL